MSPTHLGTGGVAALRPAMCVLFPGTDPEMGLLAGLQLTSLGAPGL